MRKFSKYVLVLNTRCKFNHTTFSKNEKTYRYRNEGSLQTSDDDSNDNVSVLSNYSESSRTEDVEESDELAQEQFEEKLLEVLEGLSQKSAQGRLNCLQSLYKALVKKYIPNFVRDRHFTICDGIERCLKKGAGGEKAAAADLVPLLCLQLGGEDTTEEVCRILKPILLTMTIDTSLSANVRARCCLAASSLTFLSGGDMGDVLALMQQLEAIFSGSYLKGDKSVPTVTSDTANLHAAALSAWSLLSTLLTPGDISSYLNNTKGFPTLERLAELFTSPHLEVRLTAGEALAIIYEMGREDDELFAEDTALDLTDRLKQLATDSHKYRAKKDRKQQRATFRDILSFIEEDEVPEVKIKFGRELLTLDTWVKRKQYDTICAILGPGINVHLSENELFRDIMDLTGPALNLHETTSITQQALERRQKRLMNAANFKARTISRGKYRDKRSDF